MADVMEGHHGQLLGTQAILSAGGLILNGTSTSVQYFKKGAYLLDHSSRLS